MTSIVKIRIVNFKNILYGKGLDKFLPRAMKNPQPEDNILDRSVHVIQYKVW